MMLVILATFAGLETSTWHAEIAAHGWAYWAREHLLSFHGLDALIHADTMLFILGLTFFVSVIAQTRLLEGITLGLLRRNHGAILPTVISVTLFVSFASGIFDGVSMIGLTIRALFIILLLGGAPTPAVRHAVMVCTVVTTVCGAWLAYGEPPNLIMKANLHPYLTDGFFLRYCAPAALAAYLVIAWHLRKRLRGQHVDLDSMDVLDANAEDVRFLQATRHGEVMSSVEVVQAHAADLGHMTGPVLERLREGESLGIALIRADVPEQTRKKILSHFVGNDLADALDTHYVLDCGGHHKAAAMAEEKIDKALIVAGWLRQRAQRVGIVALLPFVTLLIAHGVNHNVPLFCASFAGFGIAVLGIVGIPKVRSLAIREACHEYAEYFFLFPLFLSITLLTAADFFDQLQVLVLSGMRQLGSGHVAVAQLFGSAFLSAILDNNIVADFASRALHGLDTAVLHLFALAQIIGYAAGGCWSHIGSAQSVVAYAFIRRDVEEHYSPVQWIKEMTPVIVQILGLTTLLIYAESALISWLG
jgi:Na+/H+ antiporter NhaD/arsenite permease-like protein